MATRKQRAATKVIVENVGISVSKAMRKVGYSKASAKNPKILTSSKSWPQLLQEYLPDEVITRGVKRSIDDKNGFVRNGGLEMAIKLRGRYPVQKTDVNLELTENKKEKTLPELVGELSEVLQKSGVKNIITACTPSNQQQ